MSVIRFLLDFFSRGQPPKKLARRLQMPLDQLRSVSPEYREFTIEKRSGGRRHISAPNDRLKEIQRRILRRLFRSRRSHPAAMGFEPGKSIVTHAKLHVGRAVVVRMDLKDFFRSRSAQRVVQCFREMGWNRTSARLLARICTHEGSLPQGAPTSPKLSNLVNQIMDARLNGLAKACGATYSRYADDLTFSYSSDRPSAIKLTLRMVSQIVGEYGYHLHRRKKRFVRRQHQQQLVCGLVVNLPRKVRRFLRSVEHHHKQINRRDRPLGSRLPRQPTISSDQLAGWKAMDRMIACQRQEPESHAS